MFLAGIAAGLLLLFSPAAAGATEAPADDQADISDVVAEDEHIDDSDGVIEEDGGEAEGTITLAHAAEEAEHAAHEAGADHAVVECVKEAIENNDTERCIESPSPILPAKNEIIWGALSFALLLVALWKFGIPAATSMMDARTDRIRNDLEGADRARADAETVLADYQRQLADSRNEATRIIEEARQQADQVRRDLIARAETEAAELRQRNAEQIAGERDRVMDEVRAQVGVLAIELAERVVGASLDREANTRLVEEYISSVGTK